MLSLINWEEVAERLKKISEDKSKIYNLVENEIVKTLKLIYPGSWRVIYRKNESSIVSIRNRLVNEYQEKVVEEIKNLLSP